MNVKELENHFAGCKCGHEHCSKVKAVEAACGNLRRIADILRKYGFPEKLLLVADENTLSAAKGVIGFLENGGFSVKTHIYENLRVASMEQVEAVERLCDDCEGVLSVGTGSLNDICRLAAYRQNKEFAIFATAPSMDGFASDTAPITDGNFKMSYRARQPSVIIADTDILAASPVILKSSGFGDMIAKYTALVDWRISQLLTGEYYCENVAALTQESLDRIIGLAGRIKADDTQSAQAVFEALILTGLGMSYTGNSRPASGAEHVISHFWEIKKLQNGLESDFHGRKVGVATLATAKIYHRLAELESVNATRDNPDWDEIKSVYGEGLSEDMMKMNLPETITAQISPADISEKWGEIRKIIKTTLPPYDSLLELMKTAGAPTTNKEIDVTDDLFFTGLKYHSYMRRRVTLMRLIPMLGAGEEIYKL
ncbi:MAG: sn-glycerol-1-phosphate dehydrogenase [Clostridiales bacterium]|nr:sn-glycerol-1-phosphate dehydrogenase [Clostridiales bacterium]